MGGLGCEAAVDSSPVAEDGESDEDSQMVPCGKGDGEDSDLRGEKEAHLLFTLPQQLNLALPLRRLSCAFRWWGVIR